MSTITVSGVSIYPVKSLRGITLQEAEVTPRGFWMDRRFLVVDPNGVLLTQRSDFKMALVDTALEKEALVLKAEGKDPLRLSIPEEGPTREVKVWENQWYPALDTGEKAAEWLSGFLGKQCRLVYMPDSTRRPIPTEKGGTPEDYVSFADSRPYLIISEESLADLNQRLDEEMEMVRFRPNIVVKGATAFGEDSWKRFRIGEVTFKGVGLCGRCVITTLNPQTGEKGKEPLKTLSQYRNVQQEVMFGQNLIPESLGKIAVGDSLEIIE